MNSIPKFTRLYEVLWPDDQRDSERLYAVLDGARDSRVFGAVDGSREEKRCLFSIYEEWPGPELGWDLIGISPYLAKLEPGTDLIHSILRHGWASDWGIFFRSEASISQLRRHFRELLTVRTENGRHILFRYYDPRVLRIYLPTCQASELRTVFGPVNAFLLPGVDPLTAVEYRFEGGGLVERTVLEAPLPAN